MKDSGFFKDHMFRIILIVAFFILCVFYLWPTMQNYLEQNYIEGMPAEQAEQYRDENIAELRELRQESLSLGLDLQGGMHVTLQLDTPQLIRELAGEFSDEALSDLIAAAEQRAFQNNEDFVEVFAEMFEARNPNGRLSRYFRSDAANITRRSGNEEVIAYLEEQQAEAVDRAIEVIRNRINRFGVTEPSITKQGESRVVVQLPGVANKQRVRNLLKGTARLEFRLMANPQQLQAAKEQIIQYYSGTSSDTVATDTADTLAQPAPNPLLQVLNVRTQSRYVFGYAAANDTAEVNELLSRPRVQQILPRNAVLLWGASPFATTQEGIGLYQLIGVRNQVEMTGEVVTEASVTFDRANRPQVSISMNAQGARMWSRITGANVGKSIAIILDGVVYSFPNVNSKITGGNSVIEGLESVAEAEDLVTILLSGALPAPLEIIGERTVGASLGQEAIQSGLASTIISFIIVAIFMIVYYRKGGTVADIALVFNVIFILGILASFKATLTLPGIAGLVLTIGMAVDANVLIFERIREEQDAGKTLRASIDAGYKNAMSAIIDGNVTTFFVGVILFSFGVGPIKGFAVTLMAGIATTLFSAIVITRVLIDYLVRDPKRKISFG